MMVMFPSLLQKIAAAVGDVIHPIKQEKNGVSQKKTTNINDYYTN